MITTSLFQQALNITDPWYVSSTEFKADEKRLDIYIDFRQGSTFFYEDTAEGVRGDFKAYDTEEKVWRHLNFFEHECYLHARVPRVDIGNGKVRQIKPPWAGVALGFTLLFEALVVELCHHMPVHAVSKIIHESDRKLWDVLYAYVDGAREAEDFSNVRRVGIDETSRTKGHNYVTIFADIDARRALYVTPGRDQTTIDEFVKDFEAHKGESLRITDVTCDMSPAFIKGIHERLPFANITFDKFHVVSIINKAVDEIRRDEAKTIPLLKHSRYAVLKNSQNLTARQKAKLDELHMSKLNLKTIRALHIRQAYQALYSAQSTAHFVLLLQQWHSWARRCRLTPMKNAAATIKKHWDGIVQWFASRMTNALLEGLNSLVQAAKTKARGYRTVKNLVTITYLITAKLNFSGVNKNLLPT